MRVYKFCGLAIAHLMCLSSWSIPETVVLMPTANRNAPRSVYFMTEQYAVPRSYDQTLTRCFYTQLLLTERFDCGIDVLGFNRAEERQVVGNARWVVSPETNHSPGFAVGVWNVGNNQTPSYYLVGTRTTSLGRFHAGIFREGTRTGWSTAYQTNIANLFDLSVEYFRLPAGDAYTSFLLGRQLNEAVYLYMYYSKHSHTRDADLFSVGFSFTPFRLF